MIDYYAVLEINPAASKQEIKKAYRKLALIWHPDKNRSPNANEKFIEINEAYLILSDDEARAKYDFQYRKSNQRSYQYQNWSINEEDFRDPIFENWKASARKQAENYSNLPFEKFLELLKSIKDDLIITGSKSIFYAISRTLIFPGIGGVLGGLYFQSFEIIFVGIVFSSIAFLGIKFIKEE